MIKIITMVCLLMISILPLLSQQEHGVELKIRRNPFIKQYGRVKHQKFAVIQPYVILDRINDVDFNKETILSVYMGKQITGGCNIFIINVVEYPDWVIANVMQISPTVDDITAYTVDPEDIDAIDKLYPCDAVAIPKTTKPVLFSLQIKSGKTISEKTVFYPVIDSYYSRWCKIENTETSIITSQDELVKVWNNIDRYKVAVPIIDFNKYMVITITGSRGYEVTITEVSETKGKISIKYMNRINQYEFFLSQQCIAILLKSTNTVEFIQVSNEMTNDFDDPEEYNILGYE